MSLLLLFAGGGNFTPLVTSPILAVITDDEVAAGVPTQIWAGYVHNTGADPLVEAQVQVYRVNADATLTSDLGLTPMMPESGYWTFDWTPDTPGVFLVLVAADDGSATHQAAVHVTARSKFDPIALALHDVLVTRF